MDTVSSEHRNTDYLKTEAQAPDIPKIAPILENDYRRHIGMVLINQLLWQDNGEAFDTEIYLNRVVITSHSVQI